MFIIRGVVLSHRIIVISLILLAAQVFCACAAFDLKFCTDSMPKIKLLGGNLLEKKSF